MAIHNPRGRDAVAVFEAARAREEMLQVISEYSKKGPGFFQTKPVLNEVIDRIGSPRTMDVQQAILTIWHDLFRSGLLSSGYDIDNPDLPFCHLTERGRVTLQNAGRDPANPDGYLASLIQMGFSDTVAESYVREALNTYNTNCYKAAAVMIGAATERMVLRMGESTVDAMTAKLMAVPRDLQDWRYKTVRDAITREFNNRKSTMGKPLQEAFSAYWTSLTEQPRVARNDAGHPVSIDPVTPETVHASLLIFPELARLVLQLEPWIAANA